MSSADLGTIVIKLKGEGLPAKDSVLLGGKSDPFFEVFKAHGQITDENLRVLAEAYTPPNETYMGNKEPKFLLARSNIVKNCLDPEWFEVEIELGRLCDQGDKSKNILIDVWDYDTGMSNDFIGYVEISVQDLFTKCASNELIALKPPPKPHKQEAGHLRVVAITHYDPSTTEGKVRKALKQAFRKLDKNNNGTLDEAEVKKYMQLTASVCHAARAEAIEKEMASLDLDKDKVVRFEEFWAAAGLIRDTLLAKSGDDLEDLIGKIRDFKSFE